MKIRCDKANLTDALNSIQGIIPPNSPKPILGDFFLTTREGSLVASTAQEGMIRMIDSDK